MEGKERDVKDRIYMEKLFTFKPLKGTSEERDMESDRLKSLQMNV